MAKKVKEVKEGASEGLLKLDDIITKQFEDMEDLSQEDTSVKLWYDWGNYALNYISSKSLFNGVPAGAITSVKGLSGVGKSLLLASVVKDPKVEIVIAIEAEGAGFTKDLLQFAGADISKLRRIKCSTFENFKINKKNGAIEEVSDDKFPQKKETDDYIYEEGATRLVKRLLNQIEFSSIKANIVIVLDSLANLQSVREKSGTNDMGKKTQCINTFFRSFDNVFAKTNIAFLFTNKLYKNFANIYDPWIENGGEGAIYNPSLSLFLTEVSETEDVSDAEMKEEKERRKTALGSSLKAVRARVDKSRFGTESRTIPFLIDFATGGVWRYSGLFTLCKDFGTVVKAGSSYTMEGVFEKSFYKKDFTKLVMDGGEEIIHKIQLKLEEAEIRIKSERSRAQVVIDIPGENEDEDGDDGFEVQDMISQMSKELK